MLPLNLLGEMVTLIMSCHTCKKLSYYYFTKHLCSIQYTRLLHDKVKAIDERTAPKKEVDHSAEAAAAAVAMGGGMMGLGGTLMIGDVGGYGGKQTIYHNYS